MSSENFFSPEMKALMKNEKALGWLGIGLLVMWACAAAPLSDMTDSYSLLRKFFGYSGLLVVTITGIGLTLHMSSLESTAKALDKRLHDTDEAAKYWQQQSEAWQHHHEIIRLESIELMKKIADAEKVALFWQQQACSSPDTNPTLDLFDRPV